VTKDKTSAGSTELYTYGTGRSERSIATGVYLFSRSGKQEMAYTLEEKVGGGKRMRGKRRRRRK
jgi:hypothetical protein